MDINEMEERLIKCMCKIEDGIDDEEERRYEKSKFWLLRKMYMRNVV